MIQSTLYFLALAATTAFAKTTPVNENPTDTANPRLLGKRFDFAALPEHVDTTTGPRGEQYGYNRCNATTQGQDSRCQTLIVNSLDDFCLYAPPEPNSVIGDTESREVVWCTKGGHGTRVIPAGAITGAQFVMTPSYVEVTGFIKQELINIQTDDSGGELDSGGQDGRGNPLGGMCYSTFGGNSLLQSGSWHTFMGGNRFCLKCCNLNAPNAVEICEHRFDRIGCEYNVIAAYKDNVFESCKGEDQEFVGIYTGVDGVVSTYKQPAYGVVISERPYEPKLPATSDCRQFQSQQLFSGQPTVSITSTSTSSTASTPTSTNPLTRSTGGTSSSTTSAGAGATNTPAAAMVGRESSSVLVMGVAALFGLTYLF